jgi:2-polyprenyl-3-methyl-5-hydroxy-6-metoxy-1,4-benzoquinol methylase
MKKTMNKFCKWYSTLINKRISDKFYKDFFVLNSDWNGFNPNEDEESRLNVIKNLISKTTLSQNSMGIDVGCGRGWLVNQLSTQVNMIGIDPVKSVIRYARKIYPNSRFYSSTPKKFLEKNPNLLYDVVITSEVIEHVENKIDFLDDISKLLVQGGVIILSTPRGELRESWELKFGKPLQPREEWVDSSELKKMFCAVNLTLIFEESCGPLNIYQVYLLSKVG